MAAENGTSSSVQDPSALAAPTTDAKGKGKAAASSEDVEDTSMALDDDEDDEEEDDEADEVCRKHFPAVSQWCKAKHTNSSHTGGRSWYVNL